MSKIEIIDYRPEHQQWFESLNRTWIEKYFEMEPSDIEVLTNPDKYIISTGGAILMAKCDEAIAGTVALKKIDDKSYEFTKMAVDERYRRRGIAEQLSYASFLKATELGAETIILYSNSILKGAILLYEKIGFEHVAVLNSQYKRSDVKMVIDATKAHESAQNFFTKQREVIQ
jgi:ribosomal protein S18 acetylase RimI-like enzyme